MLLQCLNGLNPLLKTTFLHRLEVFIQMEMAKPLDSVIFSLRLEFNISNFFLIPLNMFAQLSVNIAMLLKLQLLCYIMHLFHSNIDPQHFKLQFTSSIEYLLQITCNRSPFSHIFKQSTNCLSLKICDFLCYPWLRPYSTHKLEP